MSTRKICPNPSCGRIAEESDRFCQYCGVAINAEVDEQHPKSEIPPPHSSVETAATPSQEPYNMWVGKISGASSLRATEALDVEYNLARVFVEGVVVPFQFRLTPRKADIDNLFIEIRLDGECIARGEPDEYLVANETIELNLPYRPPSGLQGREVPFKMYVGYSIAGERHTLTAQSLHTIFRAKERAARVVRDLHVSIHNQIRTGHASDPSVNNSLTALDRLAEADDPADAIRNVDIPPVWQKLTLRRCKYGGEWPRPNPLAALAEPPLHARVNRLSLDDGRARVHLITGASLVMGRNRRCDIVIRLVDSNDKEIPGWISNYHGRIEYEGTRCTLIDRNFSHIKSEVVSSTYGLFLDGKRVDANQPLELPIDKEFILSFGEPNESDNPLCLALRGRVYGPGSFDAFCHNRVKKDAIRGMTLSRIRDREELYAVIWRDLPFGALNAAWGDGCICIHREAFVWSTPQGCRWIQIGSDISIGRKCLRTMEFQPFGVHPQKTGKEQR